MEDLVQKYIHARNKANEYTKIQEDYKEKIKALLKDTPNKSYIQNGVEATLKSSLRSTIQKNNVPSDIWERYSVTTPFETLVVKKK
jgi:hypothetical protein